MKKTLLYSLAVLASVTLASCNGDYDDWANPQANEQEASAAKYGITFAAGPDAESSMPDVDGIINLVTVNSTDANVTGYTLKSLKVNGEAINGEIDGNNIQVNAAELEKILCNQNNSRASVARDMKVESKVSVNLASGDAVAINSVGETTGKLTPTATPQLDEKGYYMLGQVNGNEWDATAPVWMNKISDGVYQLKVTTTADKNWFKFYAGSKWDEGGDWKIIDTGALGCKENGCEDGSGYIYYDGDSWGKLQTMVIPGAGTWIVTLDMNNLTYTVGKPVLYMAGDANGWATNDYLAGEDGVHFTGFMFLNQNGFKFCTQPEWKGTNYGADFNTAGDAANITITEDAGYYKVDVDLENKSYVLTPIKTIGIIGSASPNGWDSDVDMTYVPYNKDTKEVNGYWEVKNITLSAGEIKFRANDDWALSWGGELDNLTTKNGGNITVEAGTYDIKLYAWAEGFAKCVMTKTKK
uniref:Outer membrane protein SusF domain-containing protein n=1 Tax=Prevotella sp. TaxID=59823 RepID=UPI00257EB175